MRKRYVVFCIGLAIMLHGPARGAEPALDAYHQALIALEENRPAEALAAFQRIVADDPAYWPAYEKIVKAYKALPPSDDVSRYFEGLRTANPPNPYADYGLGLVAQERKDYRQAIERYQQTLDRSAEFAGVYEHLVSAYQEAQRSDEGLRYLEDLLKFRPDSGFAHYGLGYGWFMQKSWSKALPLLERAVALKPDLLEAHFTRGRTYFNLIRYAEARSSFARALELAEQRPNLEAQAGILNNIGVTYVIEGQYRRALAHYERSLAISRRLHQRMIEKRTLTNMGNLARSQGNYDQALDYYRQGLVIERDLGTAAGEGINLHNMGHTYSEQGRYDQALASYQKSLEIRRRLGDRQGEVQTLSELGHTCLVRGQYDQALDYYRQSLQVLQQMGARHGEGGLINLIGEVYRKQGRYDQALEYIQKSLQIHQQTGDSWGEAEARDHLGRVYMHQKNYTLALDHLQKSLVLRQSLHDQIGQANTLSLMSDIYSQTGRFASAVERLRSALDIATEIQAPKAIWRLHADLARAQEARHPPKTEEALRHYQAAVKTINTLRNQLRQPESKVAFLEKKTWVYERLCNLLARRHAQPGEAEKGYDREAFRYAEESKARVLVELLTESRASWQITAGLDAELLKKERAVQAEISAVQVRLAGARRPAQVQELAQRRGLLHAEYEELIGELRRRHPRYVQLIYPEAATVEQCQRRLDEDTVLLEYMLGEERSLLFAVSKDRYHLFPMAARKPIEDQVTKLRKTLTPAGVVDGRAQLAYVAEASALYKLLIQPAESLLKGKKRILIVPDGGLYALPFAVLLTKPAPVAGKVDFARLPYLVNTYAIRYAPSASVWQLLGEPKEAPSARSKKFLAFADPVYERKAGGAGNLLASAHGEADPRRERDDATRGFGWKRLPYSGEEARQIAGLYPAEAVNLFLRAEASEENVKGARLWEYERIHFATHSVADETQPQFSGIILTTREGSGEDGYLQMYEIFNLRLNAQLVVLSSCDSGLGKPTNGEGMVGLMRAFFYAGAESVVASLWKIEDRSTVGLMTKFYRASEKDSLDRALHSAQRDLIRGTDYNHPYFWGAFTLYGGR